MYDITILLCHVSIKDRDYHQLFLDGHGEIGLMCTGELEDIVRVTTCYGPNDRFSIFNASLSY